MRRCTIVASIGLSLLLASGAAGTVTVVAGAGAGMPGLAASEVQRYVYVRTGQWPELVKAGQAAPAGDLIVVAERSSPAAMSVIGADAGVTDAVSKLGPEQYIIRTIRPKDTAITLIIGSDAAGTLYGAYRYAELLGVRFEMHGDAIPDERLAALPVVEHTIIGKPLFAYRGIQPFHDFPEGPDWWDLDMYKVVLSQLPKMGMNFFGLHTYPEGGVGPEPLTWIGRPEDANPDGTVNKSYPSRHFSTVSGTWGYQPKKTGDYLFGAAMLFEADDYSQDVQEGLTPWPKTPEQCNEMFDRFGAKLKSAFEHARRIGVKTCIGTETPLIVPTPVRERLTPVESAAQADGGAVATYGAAIEGTEEDPVYNSVRWNLKGYRISVPNGRYKVTLQFCEIAHNAAGVRVFDVSLQGKKVVENLDIFAKVGKNKALDYSFEDVAAENGLIAVKFTPRKEYPCIAGIIVEGPGKVKVNCGGEQHKDWLADGAMPPTRPEDIRKLYAGIFQRIMRTHPLDFYWFWTPEGWTWGNVPPEQVEATMKDLKLAIEAAAEVKAPFRLATCGWVLGPQNDRALFDRDLPKDMPLSCINRAVGHEPVEPAFARVNGRDIWAIPWMEDDPALTSTQLWAGRMRKDAADAQAYGCTGLMGIHWRTRNLGPNVSALAQACWDQTSWPKPAVHTVGATGGKAVSIADPIEKTDQDIIYQTVRVGVRHYWFPASSGMAGATLKLCEPEFTEAGKRVFGVKIQGRTVAEKIDIAAEVGRNAALDKAFGNLPVTDGWLHIEFVPIIGEPAVAGLQLNLPYLGRNINCGGPAAAGFEADPQPRPATGRYVGTEDFYREWAKSQFGGPAAEQIGALFARVDCRLPRPSNWVAGPGMLVPDGRPWAEVEKEYVFVEELAGLRDQVKGAGNLERFDYWLDTFRYLRAMARVDVAWAAYNAAADPVRKMAEGAERQKVARDKLIPLRRELIAAVAEMYQHLLATVTNASELGTIANIEQHNLPGLLTAPGEELEKLTGEKLPADCQPTQGYTGKPRLILPFMRANLDRGEALKLKLIVLDAAPATKVEVFYRPIGQAKGEWASVGAKNIGRAVYRAAIPADAITGNFEYYAQATTAAGTQLRCPATGPELAQTVVVQ